MAEADGQSEFEKARRTAEERTLGVLPICHTWGLCICLNSTFAVGGTQILVPRFDPEQTLALAARGLPRTDRTRASPPRAARGEG